MCATSKQYSQCVQLLLAAGATVDLADSGGFTALACAVSQNNITCEKLLVEAGASVDLSTRRAARR